MTVTKELVAQICKDCLTKGNKAGYYDIDMHIADVIEEVKKLERTDSIDDTANFNAGVMMFLIETKEDPDYAVIFFSDISNWACEYFE